VLVNPILHHWKNNISFVRCGALDHPPQDEVPQLREPSSGHSMNRCILLVWIGSLFCYIKICLCVISFWLYL
jgi:hypothetical protein